MRRLGESDIITDGMRVRTLTLPMEGYSGIGTDHNALTLDATVADILDISAAQVLSADAALAQGDIIIADATPNLTLLNIGPQYAHLENNNGTDVSWQANITLADDATVGLAAGGNLQFDSTPAPDQIILNSADLNLNGNDIYVPDNTADALTLYDAGALNYLRVISTDAQPVVVWNEGGADMDFRVEGSGVANALFVQGSDGFVGVNTNAPAAHLEVNAATASDVGVIVQTTDDDATNTLQEWQASSGLAQSLINADGGISVATGAGGAAAADTNAALRVSRTWDAGGGAVQYASRYSCLVGAAIAGAMSFRSFSLEGALYNTGAIAGTLFGGVILLDQIGSGSTTVVTGMSIGVRASHAACTIGTATGLFIEDRAAAGTITLNRGIFVDDQTAGTTNYAIYTSLGNVRFGDAVVIDGSGAADVQLTVQGAAAQAANLTEWQSSAPATLLAVDASGNVVVTDDLWMGFGAAAGRFVFDSSSAPDTLRATNATFHVEGSQNALAALETPTNYHLVLYNPANDDDEGVGLGWYISQQSNDVGAAIVFVRNDSETMGELRFYTKQSAVDATPPSLIMTLTDGGNVVLTQGANDDEILALKSSDVAHGFTGLAETDTYGVFQKMDGDAGGLIMRGIRDADGANNRAMELNAVLAENVETGKGIANHGIMGLLIAQSSGNAWADVVADGNLLSIRTHRNATFETTMIIDVEGTIHQIPTGGADIDMDLLTVQVTGTPHLAWDESEDAFTISHDLIQDAALANKTLNLGSATVRFNTLYQGTSTAAGTSRVFESTRDCPLCATRMVRGTGSLCILGVDRDYEVAHCPQCGVMAVEEMKHLPPERLAERKPPPKVELAGLHVFPMSGNSRKVRVDFRYADGDEPTTNSTYLGETEMADLMAMDEASRRAFLLALGRREWEALEEVRLQRQEVATLQGQLDALVGGLVGTDLLQ